MTLGNNEIADAFDSQSLRRALGLFPTGVTVVTGRDPQSHAYVGLTVSSFNSLSLSPALVNWSISSQSPSLNAFTPGRLHCVHVLHAGQVELAKQFATKKSDKFLGVALKPVTDPQEPPQLSECVATFHCTTERLIEAGDHFLVISAVTAFETFEKPSLVFCKSKFLSTELITEIET